MTARDKHEREQDRADLLAVLEEAGQPVRTDILICRAHGMADPGYTDMSWHRHRAHGLSDLRALERAGRILYASDWSNWGTWKVATDAEVDAESDRDEVERMAARWEPAS